MDRRHSPASYRRAALRERFAPSVFSSKSKKQQLV